MTSSARSIKDIFDAAPYPFSIGGARLEARPSGVLWWPAQRLICVADLHLGKAERLARGGGPFLPPYETTETLTRLNEEVDRLDPAIVVCLGDSFDDSRAPASLNDGHRTALRRMMAGRRWIWIAGNHDPAPIDLDGDHLAVFRLDGLAFRHIAEPIDDEALDVAISLGPSGVGEVSGHYHPKATLVAKGRKLSRRCFVTDGRRAILPAFGAFTGGLDVADDAFDPLMGPEAVALLLGTAVRAIPRTALIAPNAAPPQRIDRF